MQLTEHFSLAELTITEVRNVDNTPNDQQLQNLRRLAEFLEDLRVVLGKPILINSGFRSLAVNTAVGGAKKSQHMEGCAADIRVPGMTPHEVVVAVRGSKLKYQQVIREFDRWTHISIPSIEGNPPKLEALIIDQTGARQFA